MGSIPILRVRLSGSSIGIGRSRLLQKELDMPLRKCVSCHHEWEAGKDTQLKCDWCGDESKIIAEQTPLEKMLASRFFERIFKK